MPPTSTVGARTDTQVKDDVVTELRWVPDVDATHVGVCVAAGVVTLSGQVESYPEKLAAGRAAQRVRGVVAVAQELTVGTHTDTTGDADLARHAAEAVRRAVDVPTTVAISVDHRVVTLSGTVLWQYQRAAAGRAVAHLAGIRDVFNVITVRPSVRTGAIHDDIAAALVRNARTDGTAISVAADHAGVVTVRGTVRSWAERRQAELTCWSAPGVTAVVDELTVAP